MWVGQLPLPFHIGASFRVEYRILDSIKKDKDDYNSDTFSILSSAGREPASIWQRDGSENIA